MMETEEGHNSVAKFNSIENQMRSVERLPLLAWCW